MLRLIRKFFSGITDYPHQDWRSDDDDEAGMDAGDSDTDEWNNPWNEPVWDGKSIRYVDGSDFGDGTLEPTRYPHTHK
jgi:hypothetical protein